MKKETKGHGADYAHYMLDGYAYGYVQGVREAFRRQEEQGECFNLVPVIPQEVHECCSGFIHKNHGFSTRRMSSTTYSNGRTDGERLDYSTKINEEKPSDKRVERKSDE